MNKNVGMLVFILAMICLLMAGCSTEEDGGMQGGAQAGDGAAVHPGESAEADVITITDSAGRTVTIPTPIERVAILDTGIAEVLKALGVLDKVVASHASLEGHPLYPELAGVPSVATYSEVNVERLAETMPQIAISSVRAHGMIEENEHLQRFEIQDIKLNLRNPETMKEEVLLLGVIFGKEAEAARLVEFYEHYEQLISTRLDAIPAADRKKVFVEYHAGHFNTGGPGSRFYEQTVLAGADNIAAQLDGEPEVNAEWVAEMNPDVIVREASGFGYDVETDEQAEQIWQEIMARPALANTKAIQNQAVHLLSIDIYSRPAYIVGVCYLANWLYPDVFEDVNPLEVHQEYMDLVHPGIPYQGLWAYSGPDKEQR